MWVPPHIKEKNENLCRDCQYKNLIKLLAAAANEEEN
jgi:hypothetical protein